MRIIIFSDSLGRPRPDISENERTFYSDVYGSKLKNSLMSKHEVELIYIESLDSEDAIFWSQRMVAFRSPELVIFHLGINDCAPRIFNKGKKYFIFNPLFRKLTKDIFIKAISRFRPFILKFIVKNRVYVKKKNFYSNFIIMKKEILKYSKNCKFLSIGIAQATEEYELKSPGIGSKIAAYNLILKKIFGDGFIDLNDILRGESIDYLISDNIHLTKESHHEIFKFLRDKIK
jgi:hypothetical protein|tara:strand:+ start:317 stop:1012 length:696 start_codon:yes stop_codon:yes gene_type:complete